MFTATRVRHPSVISSQVLLRMEVYRQTLGYILRHRKNKTESTTVSTDT